MSIDEPGSGDHDDIEIEFFSSGPWPPTSPLATLWGSNVSFGPTPPDWAKAAAYLTRAMEHHRTAADAYAKALLMDAEIEELNRATQALEHSIRELGLARAMLSEEKQSGLAEAVRHADDEPDWIAADDEPSDETRPPDGELPVTVALGIDLGDEGTTVRVRDARVFSSGMLMMVDFLMRRPRGMTKRERRALEERFSDVVDSSDASPNQHPADGPTGAQFLAGNVVAYRHSAIAWCEYWVETNESDETAATIDFTFLDPLSPGPDRRRVSLDAQAIADARAHVIRAAARA